MDTTDGQIIFVPCDHNFSVTHLLIKITIHFNIEDYVQLELDMLGNWVIMDYFLIHLFTLLIIIYYRFIINK